MASKAGKKGRHYCREAHDESATDRAREEGRGGLGEGAQREGESTKAKGQPRTEDGGKVENGDL